MTGDRDADACDRFEDVATELALGIAVGEERANALAHVASCESCRERLSELSATVDGLLMLAPSREPSMGFESEVQRRIEAGAAAPPRRARSRFRGILPAALAGAAILILGASWMGTRDDRRLASDYRQALGEVDGNYFTTFALTGPGSRRVGSGFAYEGDPSWVFITLDAPGDSIPSGSYELHLELAGGSAAPAAPIEVRSGHGSGGVSFTGDLGGLDGLSFRGKPGRIDLSATSTQPIYP